MKEFYAKQKERLPEFDLLDSEFEISTIDTEAFYLREVLRKIQHKMEIVSDLLESLMQPSPESFAQMHECHHLAPEEKTHLVTSFKRIHYLSRWIDAALVDGTNKELALVITETTTTWTTLKPFVTNLLKKLRDTWEAHDENKEDIAYFG